MRQGTRWIQQKIFATEHIPNVARPLPFSSAAEPSAAEQFPEKTLPSAAERYQAGLSILIPKFPADHSRVKSAAIISLPTAVPVVAVLIRNVILAQEVTAVTVKRGPAEDMKELLLIRKSSATHVRTLTAVTVTVCATNMIPILVREDCFTVS